MSDKIVETIYYVNFCAGSSKSAHPEAQEAPGQA